MVFNDFLFKMWFNSAWKRGADCQHFFWPANSGFCLEWAGNKLDLTSECVRGTRVVLMLTREYTSDHMVHRQSGCQLY